MIPFISREQSTNLDKFMVEHGVTVEIMMELAGYRIAEFIRDNFSSKDILICCGKGNNGGDGLAAARHLKNFDFEPKVFIADTLNEHAQNYYQIAKNIGIPIVKKVGVHKIVLDCLLGYNLKGNPRYPLNNIIEEINENNTIISVDLPSGVDVDKGVVYDPYVKATHILALSLPKQGAKDFPAEHFVADIGVFKEIYSMINVSADNYFKERSIIGISQAES